MESPLELQNYVDVTGKPKVSNFRLQVEDLAFGSVCFYYKKKKKKKKKKKFIVVNIDLV
jgi:hypothetical protein